MSWSPWMIMTHGMCFGLEGVLWPKTMKPMHTPMSTATFLFVQKQQASLTVRVHFDFRRRDWGQRLLWLRTQALAFLVVFVSCNTSMSIAWVAVLALCAFEWKPRFTTRLIPHVNNSWCKWTKVCALKSIDCARYTLHKLQIVPYVNTVYKNRSIFEQFVDSSNTEVNQMIA